MHIILSAYDGNQVNALAVKQSSRGCCIIPHLAHIDLIELAVLSPAEASGDSSNNKDYGNEDSSSDGNLD